MQRMRRCGRAGTRCRGRGTGSPRATAVLEPCRCCAAASQPLLRPRPPSFMRKLRCGAAAALAPGPVSPPWPGATVPTCPPPSTPPQPRWGTAQHRPQPSLKLNPGRGTAAGAQPATSATPPAHRTGHQHAHPVPGCTPCRDAHRAGMHAGTATARLQSTRTTTPTTTSV